MVILAAGQGKRMMSDLPKVAHNAAGRPLIEWVLQAVAPLDPTTIVVVVGHGAESVTPLLPGQVTVAHQAQQLGTGHATEIGIEAIPNLEADDIVVVLYGDMPLVTTELVQGLARMDPAVSAVMVTTKPQDPTGYGRVIRDASGAVVGVVEEADCSDEQRLIDEINAGIYAFRAGVLQESLGDITDDNSQGEFYLTDLVSILTGRGDQMSAVEASPEEVMGINSQDQLAEAQAELRRRINRRLVESGVWMLDPERTYIDDTVTVEPGARIYPGVYLEGDTVVRAGARVGPDVTVIDSEIGVGATVWYAVVRSSVVGADCQVGPYASLRPGTVLEKGAKVGTYVETKNTTLGEGAKAPHLSYLGDATVGARANIGAGTITCNYDGYEKHETVIGEEAKIGSDTMLVAPVKVGDRAFTGAGSVISKDVSDDALAIERTEQKEIPDYAQRRAQRRSRKAAED